jgi:hypothetical protein
MKNHWLNKEIDLDIDKCDLADFQASAYCWEEFQACWQKPTEYTMFYDINCGTPSIIPDNIGLADEGLTVFAADKVEPENIVEENKLDLYSQVVVDRGDLGIDFYNKWETGNKNNRKMATYLNGVEEKQFLNWLLEKHTGHKNLLEWLILKTENNE